jgi:hypothetical protein
MLNRIWRKDHFQSVCRSSTVIPILKHGRDRNVAMTYRPISLTSWTCRLHRRMVNRHLIRKLEPENWSSPPPIRASSTLIGVDHLGAAHSQWGCYKASLTDCIVNFEKTQFGSTQLYIRGMLQTFVMMELRLIIQSFQLQKRHVFLWSMSKIKF